MKSSSDAHALLQILISRAILEGRIGEATINIPFIEVADPYEGIKVTEDALDIVLKVTISTEWGDIEDSPTKIETSFEEEENDYADDAGEEERPGRKPNPNKKSQ